jgi:hypothetical protein
MDHRQRLGDVEECAEQERQAVSDIDPAEMKAMLKSWHPPAAPCSVPCAELEDLRNAWLRLGRMLPEAADVLASCALDLHRLQDAYTPNAGTER